MQTAQENNNRDDIKVRVGEIPSSAQRDIGIGIIRIDTKTMQKINIREGDVVEIEGKRKTGAIALRAYPSDAGVDVIRMDGYMRRNAGTGIGEYVTIKKAEIHEAKSITLAPAEKGVFLQMSGDQLQKILMNRIITKGDIIVPSQAKRSKMPDISEFLNIDIEEIFGGFGFGEMRLIITSTTPKDICKITEVTNITVISKAVEVEEDQISTPAPAVTYEDVGGIKDEVKRVREMIELPIKHPELFERLGIEPPKGVLLHGPPGTGKTLLARAVAAETDVKFYSIAGPEIISKFYGESEQKLRKIFEDAEENAPSIIFIDELDAIAPKREEVQGEVERRVVAQLLATMDGLKARGQVVVIGATNRVKALDPALRRPGRFDREIEIGVPDEKGRLEVLHIHSREMPLTDEGDLKVELTKFAKITHGFVGADLQALCREAAMKALRRYLPKMNLEEDTIPEDVLDQLEVNSADFQEALREIQPSAVREVFMEIPNVRWSDVGGLDLEKQQLIEVVDWPLKSPESFTRLGIHPPKGVLIWGPPGCGKTLLAKAVATESEANFISVKGPELLSKWFGESEKAVREIFRKARTAAPAIIFFDEIESIAPIRGRGGGDSGGLAAERVISQLLTEMDGLESMKDVIVLAATNRPDLIDRALLRTGRFDRFVFINSPDTKGREEIIKIYTKNMPLDDDVDLKRLGTETEMYGGGDIEALCREAGMLALREDMEIEKVAWRHFEAALKTVHASVTPEDLEKFKKMDQEFKRAIVVEQSSPSMYG